MILCISVLSVVISPFSFLILLIWFFSLCFLMSLANGLSILFILSKNQLLALLIFAMVSFASFAFISALIFMISFLLLTLACLISSFSSCLCVQLGYLFDFPPVSWGRLILLWTLPLALLLLIPIGFGLLCFHFHSFLCVFWFLLSFVGYSEVCCLASICLYFISFFPVQFSSVQSLSHVRLFVTPWIAAYQASLSITNFQSLLRLTSIESVMPSSHLILCHPLLLLPPIPPSIRVFSNESTLCMRWPKFWSFSFSFNPSCSGQLILLHCDQKRCLRWFQFFWIYQD